jgi:hypothetical protein
LLQKKTLSPGGFAEKWEVGEEIRGDTALPPVLGKRDGVYVEDS